MILVTLLGAASVMLVTYLIAMNGRSKRQAFIDSYLFTAHQYSRVQITYPHLTDAHFAMVARGLKTFFSAHLHQPSTVHAMPSKAVDALWHAFILDTRAYQSFCKQAFGSYFHHIPSSRMNQARDNDSAMERMWRFACKAQGLNPVMASTLPALFILDAVLGIPEGFKHDATELVVLSKAYDERHASVGGESGSSGYELSIDGDSGCGGGCGGGGD